jgi:hypothetical protein
MTAFRRGGGASILSAVLSVLGNSVEEAMRIAQILAVGGALTLATAIPVFAGSQSKLPQSKLPEPSIPSRENRLPKWQLSCRAPCDWAFNKCVGKVQDTIKRGGGNTGWPWTDKQNQEFAKCATALLNCLQKRNCPVGADCTKDKSC